MSEQKTRLIEYYDVGNGTGKFGMEVDSCRFVWQVGDKNPVPEKIAKQMVKGGGFRFADGIRTWTTNIQEVADNLAALNEKLADKIEDKKREGRTAAGD